MMKNVKENFQATSKLLNGNLKNEVHDPVNKAISKLKESQENMEALKQAEQN